MPSWGDKSPYTEKTILMVFLIKLWMTYFKGQIIGVFLLTARNVKGIQNNSEFLRLGNKDFNIERSYNSGQNTLTNLFSCTFISTFIFIAKTGNGPLLFMGTKLQMLLYSKPNVFSYWCSSINHKEQEFYGLGKMEPPRFVRLLCSIKMFPINKWALSIMY